MKALTSHNNSGKSSPMVLSKSKNKKDLQFQVVKLISSFPFSLLILLFR